MSGTLQRNATAARKRGDGLGMMTMTLTRTILLAGALALAGCQDTLDSVGKAERPLPQEIVNSMKAKGMSRYSPVTVRIFKEEGVLEVWKQKDTGRYDLIKTYEICKWSGKLGPKFTEGDRQAPEGFYTVRPAQMNPRSLYHLSFNIGYPNAYDTAHGRTGAHLMVHGACSSAGCYSMTDAQVEEIYAFARDSFRGGQREFQVQAYPFRMTPANMARYLNDPNYDFWVMLKEGYDHFEITKVPPKVDVCEKRYVFNKVAPEGESFRPTAQCPEMTQPMTLASAYGSYQKQYSEAFAQALTTSAYAPPQESIAGLKEARLVAEWSKRRARGERVSSKPPSLARTAPVGAVPKPEPAPPAPAAAETPSGNPARPGEAAAAAPAAETTASAENANPQTIGGIPVPGDNPKKTGANAAAGDSNAKPAKKPWWNPFGG